jgi:hypothetical protein
MEQLDNNKEGEDEQDSEVSDTCSTATEKSGLSDSWKERPTEFQRRRARLDSKEAPSPRPHVRFNQPFPAAAKNSGIRNKMSPKPTVSTGTTPTVYTIESDDATTIAQHGRRPRRSPPASHGGTTGDSTSNAIDSGKDISKAGPFRSKHTSKISIGELPPMYSEVSSKDTKEILKDKGLRKDVSKSQHKRVVPRGNSTPGTLLNDGRYDHPLYQPKPPDTAAPLQYSSPRRNPFLYPRTNAAIDYTPPVHPPEAQWNPFVNSYMNGSAAAWSSSVPPPPPATSVPNPTPPPMPVSDNPRLSKIEDLLANHQGNLAQLLREQREATVAKNEAETKNLSATTSRYEKIAQELGHALENEQRARQKLEEEAVSERSRLESVVEAGLVKVQGLEEALAHQREELEREQSSWLGEKQTLQARITSIAETKEVALRNAVEARAVTNDLTEHIATLKVAAETERRVRMEEATRAAEARKKADADSTERFQRYQRLLKESTEVHQRVDLDERRSTRPTLRLKDSNRSIEVSGYTADTLGCSMNTLLLPQRLYQDDSPGLEIVTRDNCMSWSRRERHNSFIGPSRSLQSASVSIASFGNKTNSRQSQQTLLFPLRSNANVARLAELQESLDKAGLSAVIQDSSDHSSGEVIMFNGGTDPLVQSTVFWDPPMLDLGSELLSTYRQYGWKPTYCRRSGSSFTPLSRRSLTLSSWRTHLLLR